MSRGMTADDAFDAPETHYPRRAVLEILRDHGVKTVSELADFFDEMADSESYSLAAVLLWLGY